MKGAKEDIQAGGADYELSTVSVTFKYVFELLKEDQNGKDEAE